MPDPAQPQTFNRYTYVFNRPLVLNDPSGHCPWCIGAIGGAIAGAVVGYGAQVYQNMQNGQSFTAALKADIDAGKIVARAVVGVVVGGTLGAAAPALTTYGTVAVAQVQTTAVAAAAAHPTAAAAVGGLVETAVECAMTGGGCGAADYVIGVVTAGAAHRLSQGRIYRSASGTPDSLTPRPGIDDVPGGGLSFFDSLDNPEIRPGDKYVSIDVTRLNTLTAIFDNKPPGHVTVTPQSATQLRGWAATRGTGQIHPFTEELLNADLQIGKKPR